MSAKNIITAVVAVFGFFAASYVWGALLEILVPQLVATDPWGVVESITAIAAMFAAVMLFFFASNRRYKVRTSIFLNAKYKLWLVTVASLICIGTISAIIGASLAKTQWLQLVNWGNYVNILACSALLFVYNITLLSTNPKQKRARGVGRI